MNFKVRVNSKLEYHITSKELSEFDIIKTTDSKHHVLYNNKSYHSEILNADFNNKCYQVKINNHIYSVNIHNDLDKLIDSMGFVPNATKVIGDVKAPMPGLILEISVTIGQQVKENDPLLILEAMKMENSITSPKDGIIKSILVKQGDAVEKNCVLIEFE